MSTPSPIPLDPTVRRQPSAATARRDRPALLVVGAGAAASAVSVVRGGVLAGDTDTGTGMACPGGAVNRQAGSAMSVDHPSPPAPSLFPLSAPTPHLAAPSPTNATPALRTYRLSVPIRTVNALNAREHPMARSARVKRERIATAWALRAERITPATPCVVTLTRCGPTRGLDPGDNLAAALKGVRDAIASWLNVDDGDEREVRYRYAQRRAPQWSVDIAIREARK